MQHPRQSVNQNLDQRVEALSTGGFVASPFTGSVNTAILLFAVAATITGPAAFIDVINSATLGTLVRLRKAGRYSVEFGVVTAASGQPVLGVSENVAAAGLTGDASFAINGIVDVLTPLAPAATNLPVKITTEVIVPPSFETAADPFGVRFHASASGNPPANLLIQASGYFRVRYLGLANPA